MIKRTCVLLFAICAAAAAFAADTCNCAKGDLVCASACTRSKLNSAKQSAKDKVSAVKQAAEDKQAAVKASQKNNATFILWKIFGC